MPRLTKPLPSPPDGYLEEARLWDRADDVNGVDTTEPVNRVEVVNEEPDNPALSEVFQKIHRQYSEEDDSGLLVEFHPYVTLKHTIRLRNGKRHLRISDIMMDAPTEALEAIGHILFSKIARRRCPERFRRAYDEYALSAPVREAVLRTHRKRGHKEILGAKGRSRNLEDSFRRVNRDYFQGRLDMPTLTWTRQAARTRLGTYDQTFHTVTINRKLDSKRVPVYVLDYIMFHELLHVIHPVRRKNGRRVVHAPEFCRDERKFRDYDRAVQWLESRT